MAIDKKKILYVVLAVLVVGLIIYFISTRKSSVAPQPKNGAAAGGASAALPTSFPLRFGSVGSQVKTLQQYLLDNGGSLPNYGVDGDWGAETQAAVTSVLAVNEVSQALYTSLGLS